MTITAEQMRAARAILRMEQGELASLSGMSLGTVKRLEGEGGTANAQSNTLEAIITALESAGVEFTPATSLTGPGVRLRLSPIDPFRAFAERVAAAQPGDDLAAFIEEARKLLA